MSLDGRQEVVEHAESKGWEIIRTADDQDVFKHDTKGGDKFIFIAYNPIGDVFDDDCKLVIPHRGLIYDDEDDPEGEVIEWWLDGNEGDSNDWWNQLPEEQKR